MSICRRCIVSGRVQGVYYRGSTATQAEALGLTGSATNLPDGTVEVIVCGDAEGVERLQQWLWQGSEWSVVSGVQCETLTEHPCKGFVTR